MIKELVEFYNHGEWSKNRILFVRHKANKNIEMLSTTDRKNL